MAFSHWSFSPYLGTVGEGRQNQVSAAVGDYVRLLHLLTQAMKIAPTKTMRVPPTSIALLAIIVLARDTLDAVDEAIVASEPRPTVVIRLASRVWGADLVVGFVGLDIVASFVAVIIALPALTLDRVVFVVNSFAISSTLVLFNAALLQLAVVMRGAGGAYRPADSRRR